jgi:hypothetical protein
MLPEYPKFKSLELDDLILVSQRLDKNPRKICELALANLLIWRDFDHPKVTLINDNLCLLVSPPNESPYFLESLGHKKILETVEICLKDIGKISRATEDFVSNLSSQKYRITCLRNHFDYVYSTKILAELKGKKFDGKRNHIKKFQKRFPEYKFIPLDPGMRREALDLFEAWFAIRKESRFFPKLAYTSQKAAVEKAFTFFTRLNLIGGALFVENSMKGFILGSPQNAETLSVHFSYGHPGLQGTFQILLWEACNKLFSNFKYINLEQDLGIPGLRKAKLSYYPLRLEKKYEILPIQ